MIDLRIGRQTFDFDCGAKALQLVMEYFGVETREDELMKELKTGSEGTSRGHMVSVAKKNGFDVFSAENVTMTQVKSFIDRGLPVIVALQAWADKYMTLSDWRAAYDYGHYAVVIGHQGRVIVFEDPSSIRRTWMTEKEFLSRWHDMDPDTGQKIHHYALVLMGKQPANRIPEHMD